VRFEVRLNDSIDDLVIGGFDVALRIGELPDSSLVARRLGRIPVTLVASPALMQKRRPRTLADIEGWPVIAFRPPGSRQRRGWAVPGADGSVALLDVSGSPIEVDSVEAVVDLARAGAGMALVPRYLVEAALAEKSLVEVLPRTEFRGPTVHLCYAHRELVPPRVRQFIEALVGAVRPRLAS
jgi:DNA-binding transcriptional LysR family regulator